MARGAPICVFSPTPMVTVMVEEATDGATDIHFHAGGQGHWVARMIDGLGESALLCVPLGGETGQVFRALVEAEGIALAAVDSAGATASYVHDRRGGEREELAASAYPVADRHELDELHNAVVAHAVAGEICVLAGHPEPGEAWVDHYGRLAGDLREIGVPVVADLCGELLEATLARGITTLKVSDEELGLRGEETAGVVAAVEELAGRGADNVVVTRGEESTVARYGGRTFVVEPPRLEVVDGRGGGDATTAALAVALRRGLDAEAALRLAAAAAATSVARRGLGTAAAEAVESLTGHVDVRPVAAARA